MRGYLHKGREKKGKAAAPLSQMRRKGGRGRGGSGNATSYSFSHT